MPNTFAIRRLNDAFRSTLVGGGVMLTPGVTTLPDHIRTKAIQRMREFDAFNEDKDSIQEHDFGSFKLGGYTFYFKLDYYDMDMQWLPANPDDPNETNRVLTLMLSTEY